MVCASCIFISLDPNVYVILVWFFDLGCVDSCSVLINMYYIKIVVNFLLRFFQNILYKYAIFSQESNVKLNVFIYLIQ